MNTRERRARQLLGDDAIAAAQQVADDAPQLTPEQRDQLAVLLRPLTSSKAAGTQAA